MSAANDTIGIPEHVKLNNLVNFVVNLYPIWAHEL